MMCAIQAILPVVVCQMFLSWCMPQLLFAEDRLTQFQDSNFGVRFNHSNKVSTTYDPHGGADRVTIDYQGKPFGGLLIRPAPPAGSTEDFIAAGKEFYKTKYSASSVDSTTYENPYKIKFHVITARIKVENTDFTIERYVYLRDRNDTKDEASAILAKLSGAYSFEFGYPKDLAQQLVPELRTIVNSFHIEVSP